MESLMPHIVIFFKLFLALVLGGSLGLERNIAGKKAGLRTYSLVSMGSALFVVISEILVTKYMFIASIDPSRIASQIIVGIGFVGAGLIIFKDNTLRGLTTAVGIWVAAGIGMVAGLGLYSVSIIATALTLFVFVILWFVEDKIKKNIPIEPNDD